MGKKRSKFGHLLMSSMLTGGMLAPFSSAVQAEEALKLDRLLITEIAPDIKGAEDYEYFELHNPTAQEINLKDFQFYYVYTDGKGGDLPLSFGEYVLKPNETVVLWYNKSSKTKEDFRDHYEAELPDEAILEFTGSGFTGMANTGNRGIKIVDGQNAKVSFASYVRDETGEGLSKHFKSQPESAEMLPFQIKGAPSPGIISAGQISVPEGENNTAPVITHTPAETVEGSMDLQIEAVIEDDQELLTAVVYYQSHASMKWKSVPLVKNGDNTYAAAIPAADYLGGTLSYYIEAADGMNTTAFPADKSMPVQTKIETVQETEPQSKPRLMITEITPDTADVNGKDGYEFIEIYNNADQAINLKDYQIIYRYPNNTQLNWDLAEDKMVEPQSSAVVWIKNGANDETGLESFNENYGTSLDASQVIEIHNDGMANGSERTLIIADDLGTEIAQASYNNSSTDVYQNSGITYKTPAAGRDMVKAGISEKAAPGSVLPGQVPSEPVKLSDDSEAPVITHEVQTEIEGGQDAVISATVTDNTEVQAVSLSYRAAEAAEWKTVKMLVSGQAENVYEAVIPEADLRSKQIVYKIEATDGINSSSTGEALANITPAQYAKNEVPPLLITEVVPDSTNVNALDGYEFIEVYNNTDKPINFKDYKIRYRYPMEGPEADLIWGPEKEDIIIPSGEAVVFWIINTGNTDKTAKDFNSNYFSNLEENKNLFKMVSNGMANTGDRGIIIATNTGREIAASFYNDEPNKKDTAANKGIFYAFPTDKTTNMVKISAGADNATPGAVMKTQVPAAKAELKEDTKAPAIEDLSSITEVNEKEDLQLLFAAADDQDVKTMRLFYRTDSNGAYRSADLQPSYDDGLYHFKIYSPELIGKDKVEYYTLVSDGTHTIESEPAEIKITGGEEETGLRLNVKNDSIVTKETILKAASASGSYENIKLKIDGESVAAETYKALEKQAYFAFDVKKTNLFFQNGVTMGDEVLKIFDDTINSYVTMTVPIEPDKLSLNEPAVISVRSGTKVSPFDQESEENRDDFYIKNARLVLSDGTVIYDPAYSDKEKELTVGDAGSAKPVYDFSFEVPEEKFAAKAYKWNTLEAGEGEHTITATEGDSSASSKVIVDNSAPLITASVENGKEYKGSFTLDADVEDEWSGVTSVSAALDGKEVTLPYDTGSAQLDPGSHTFEITAIDLVGNTGKESVVFKTADEHPAKPKALSPEDGAKDVKTDAKLSVEVSDPTNDDLSVRFYKGFEYKPADAEVSVFSNSADREPPAEMIPAGETLLAAAEEDKMNDKDGEYVTTSSVEKFPYQRFEVKVDSEVDETDIIQIDWEGKSLLGRKVSMYVWNFNSEKWEVQQWKVADQDDFTLTASVQGKQYMKDQKIQVMVQDEISAETPFDYTMVWMSDTQYYSESYPHIYKKMVDWVDANKENLKIPYVFHTGDLVDVSTDPQQWAYADEYMNVLEDADIPYGVLAGNHDVDHKTNDYTQYSQYFGEERFADKPYYGGSYKDNRGHYDLISVNGNDYIMVYMGWGVEDADLEWLKDVLAQYPDRMAFLNFHEYLLVSGNRSPLGNKIFEEIVKPNKNVLAVLCGHYHDSETLVDEIDDDGDGTPDRKVYQMLADYQGGPEGGQGYMRLLHVNPSENKIYVKTYSPYLNDYNFYDADSYPGKDEFVIDLPLEPKEKVVSTDRLEVKVYTDSQIGETQTLSGKKAAETGWAGLEANKLYGWYVRVNDEFSGEALSDIWSFTTGNGTGGGDNGNQGPAQPSQPPAAPPAEQKPGEILLPSGAVQIERKQNEIVTAVQSSQVPGIVSMLNGEKKVIPIMLEKTAKGETAAASIPAVLFRDAAAKQKDAFIRIKNGEASITLPVSQIQTAELAEKMGTNVENLSIVISVNEAAEPAFKEMAEKNKLTLASKVMEFTAEAAAGEKKQALENFSSYLNYELAGSKEFNAKTASVIRFNSTGAISSVPALFKGRTAEFKSLAGTVFAVSEDKVSFPDVDRKSWPADYIETLASKHIIKGKADGTYAPLEEMTRAQFTVLLVRALGLPAVDYDNRFKDVKGTEWFNSEGELMAAVQTGIIQGKEDGNFAPNERVTRAQAAAMISRAMDIPFIGFNKNVLEESKKASDFKDAAQFAPWAKEGIEAVYQADIVSGREDGRFDPNGYTRRDHMAKILANFLIAAGLMDDTITK
ncbi:S-layer homology domain-containing protein [Bacillus infantis]|uniref:Metallophosphoesterase n=1 Tax=Bacillus infantis TaxID=324767 RepID=A0A5D4RG89_9BACI|nr:S-layer homology domain-containing protein [Bacillus infantis]TYS50317.1 metallophosphoesterase [Bacillus infantis]